MAANHAEQNEISILEIHDETLSQGVHGVFSARNKFLVYGVQRGKDRIDWNNQYLHEIGSKSVLYNDYVRKLVSESHAVFLSLNKRAEELENERKNIEIPKFCQKYRSILLACIEEIEDALDSSDNEELFEMRDMFQSIELVWHLLQTLIIDSQSGTRVLYKLLEWIQLHFLSAEQNWAEISSCDDPSSHPDYWDTIIQFLLQGKILTARGALALHPKFERDDFASLNELLAKMPLYFSSNKMSLNEFRIRWKHWQEECKGRLQRGEFTADNNLNDICKILCGDAAILTEKSYLCNTWYHLMVSFQLFTDPCINFTDLGNVARAFYDSALATKSAKLSVIDTIILAAMELDMMNVIQLSCQFNDGWWFVAHMMDLLTRENYLQLDSQHNQEQMLLYRNYLLTNYAETLMTHSSLWEVGISYLDQCAENGRAVLEMCLEKIPLETETKAKKIVQLARMRNMENLVKTISNIMMSRAMANGKLGTALSWLMYSKDTKFADELADRWMEIYTDKRKIVCFEILHNLGSCMLVSDKLTFIGKYCEFHKLYGESELKKAASLLLTLLSSEIAPPNFQMIMLLDALPLLETTVLIFSSRDTYQLMKCLEDVVLQNDKKKSMFLEDKENLIRLALVRNLARSFVLETGELESEDQF